MICRIEEMIAMILIYRSPPVCARALLHAIETRLFVTCMTNEDSPRLMMFRISFPLLRNSFHDMKVMRRRVVLPVRKRITNSAESAWENTVAMAAP